MDKNTESTKNITKALIAAACVAGFLWMMLCVMNGGVSWDDPVREWFYGLRNPGLTTLVTLITYLGTWPAISVMCLLLLIYPNTRKPLGVPVTAVAIMTTIVKAIVKQGVMRPRPDVSLHLIEQGGYSFPSGHAITAIAVYGLVFVVFLRMIRQGKADYVCKTKMRRALLLTLIAFLAIAIGISRIYLGVHFPSDVIAGWLAGIACTCIVLIFEEAKR